MKLNFLVFFVLIFASCAPQVKTLQKPSVDFESFESWCWMSSCDPIYRGPYSLYEEQVIDELFNSIAFNMYEKGYVQGDENSDLLVNFHLDIKKQEMEVSDHPFSYEEFNVRDQWINSEFPEYVQYLKGSLVIDIIDNKTSQVVWRSTAVGYSNLSPEFDKNRIWKNVKKTMRKLPKSSTK